MTLGLVYNHPNILLGLKKVGFGKDRWNGFGGKVKEGEKLEDGLIREFREECGITPTEYFKQGTIYFQFENDPEIFEVNFFNISKYEGEPIETEEMKPQWFKIDNIPFDKMWPSDPLWFPLFLKGNKFEGNVFFKDQNTIIRHELKIVQI